MSPEGLPYSVSVSVVGNSSTDTFHLFYRVLKSLRYPVEFQEDHKLNHLRVMTDSLDNFSKISYLMGMSYRYDIGWMLNDIGCGRYEELGAILIGGQGVEINYKSHIKHKMITSQMRPLLERCFILAYQTPMAYETEENGNKQQQCQELYQQLTKKGVTPIDSETIGLMWCRVIQDIQTRNPELVP